MRRAVCLLCILAVTGSLAFAQSKVTLNCKGVSLRNVMTQINQQTSLSFAFSDSINPDKIMISVEEKNSDLDTILKKILTPYGITYKIVGKQIILSKGKAEKSSVKSNTGGKIKVSGVVRDDTGATLP